MKTKISIKHVCSLFLIIALIFTTIPLAAVAQGVDTERPVDLTTTEAHESISATGSQDEEKESIKQSEIAELRTETTKHFDMGDGTYQAVTYSRPVHRKDASGQWQNIDNTLFAQKTGLTVMYATKDSRVKFASKFSSSASLVTLSENGYIIDMSFVSPDKGEASVATVDNSKSSNNLLFSNRISKKIEESSNYSSTSTIKYNDVRTNVDLEYVLYSNDVKENIVVRGRCSNYTYTFKIKLINLVAELNDSGVVYFRDSFTGDVKYLIPTPYMYDSDGNISYNVSYQLKEVDLCTYEFIIIADAEWINASERVFPVVIDPTVSLGSGITFDTYVNATDSTTKDTNYGYEPTMWISNLYRTAFVKSLSMPTIPVGATIIDARLEAAYYYYAGVTGGMYVTAHQVNKDWRETYSWNDMSNNGQDTTLGISSTVLSITYLGASTSYPQWASINVTNAAISWYNGGTSATNGNYGVALKYKSGNGSVIFHSYEAENGYAPYFIVTYTPIQQGVYALSMQNTTSYARCNTVNGGTYLSQQTFSTPPASESNRHAMFKIAYRAATDDYVLRNMVNNEVVIYANVGYNAPLSIKLKDTSDSAVPSEKAWKITATNDGFYNISCKISGTTYYMYMPSSGNLELTTNNTLSGAKWNFHKYTGETFRGWGQIDEWPEHIVNGSSATIEAYIYSTVINENRAWFSKTSVDPDVATATRPSYSAQLTITPKYGGNTKIQIEANVGSAVFGYHYLMSGWDNGCFFIQNQYNSECLTTAGGASEAELRVTSMPNGSNNQYAVWRMEYWGNGYYWIVQDATGESIYDNSNSTTYNIRTKPWTGSARQENLWKFVPQSDGTVKIHNSYSVNNNTGKFLSLDNISTKNIRSLSNTGNKQLWKIEPLILNVSVIYDQGFVDRYGSPYLNKLKSVYGNNSNGISFSSVFYDRFGIRLDVSFSSTVYQSYPYTNSCIHKNAIDTYCTDCKNVASDSDYVECSNGLHHKAELSFLGCVPNGQLLKNGEQTNILYTGHRGCYSDGSSHSTQHAYGWAYTGGNRIVVMSALFNTPLSSGNIDDILKTTVHEHLHNFGASHCDKSEDCIMSKNTSTINVNLTMCTACRNTVNQNKYQLYKMSFNH